MLIELFIQLLGLIGFILLLLSYWREDIKDILLMQVISGMFYVLHYFFLGAYSALFVYFFEIIRDYAYYKTNVDKYIFIGTIPVYIVSLFFTFNSLMSLLPIGASIIDGYGLSIRKETAVICSIIVETLWLFYDYNCCSYIGVITGMILIGSDILVLYKDRFNK